MPKYDFFIPRLKCELLEALFKRWPNGKFKKMRIRQLRAIYIRYRQEGRTK